ncbi:unnamed protein product [Durusdinium trenchii]|uniref:Uncharacterized protein n=1 Tax=Durusdinium trenchii TaxID=1381693 RepID=A0ABP0NR84_9DINO
MLLPNAVEEVATNSSFRGETSSFDHILPEKKPKDDSQELEKQEKQQRQERRQRKRQEMKDMKQRRLAHFLKTYGFSTDVNEPRVEAGCFFFTFRRQKKDGLCCDRVSRNGT